MFSPQVSLAEQGKTQREIAAEVGVVQRTVSNVVEQKRNSSGIAQTTPQTEAQPTPETQPAATQVSTCEAPDLEAIREKAYAEAYAEAFEEGRLAGRARVLDLIARAQAVGCPVAVAHAAIRQGLDPDQARAIVDAAGVASGQPPKPGRTH